MQLKQLTTMPVDNTDAEMNNNTSDADDLRIDSELTKDITPDTINSSPESPNEKTAEMTSSSTINDVYNFIENRLISLDPEMTMALGNLTYHSNFHPHYFPPEKEGGFGKTLYKKTLPDGKNEADELGLVFFGEICPSIYGTAITAKGNHYAGSPKYPKVRFFFFFFILLSTLLISFCFSLLQTLPQ